MDPLRPFSALIRSLRTAAKASSSRSGAARTDTPASGASSGRVAALAAAPAVHDRLRSRLAQLPEWNAARARELFVESVLLTELGDDLGNDASFLELTRRVSEHLDAEPKISARLDDLLRGLAGRL